MTEVMNLTLHAHSRIGLLLCIAILSFSCRHANDTTQPIDTTTQTVTFLVDVPNITFDSGDAAASACGICAASGEGDLSLSQANMTDLWVLEDGVLLAHQTSTDPAFGSPSVELPYGEHTITFVSSPQPDQTFVDGVWSAPKAADTFGYIADIFVSSSSSTEPIVLYRLTYGLKWQSTDLVPSGTKTLRLSVSPMRESLTDGLHATNPYTRTYTYDVSAYIGRTISVTVYGLPAEYMVEDNITTTIDFLDAAGSVLFTHTATAPVLSNRRTILSGRMFSNSASTAIRLNSEWLTDYETTF